MAGESSRFKSAGYIKPKFMLPLAGKTLFDFSVMSFKKYFNTEKFIFATKNDELHIKFVEDRLSILGVKKYEIIPLKNITRGQAESAYLALKNVRNFTFFDNEKLCIFNIDTIRPAIDFPSFHGQVGWLETFITDGDHWSFVKPSKESPELVDEVSEKIRISQFCSTGLYAFKSISQFIESFYLEENCPTSSELYVAPLYNRAINSGQDIKWTLLDPMHDKIYLAGTPAEYENLKFSISSGLII